MSVRAVQAVGLGVTVDPTGEDSIHRRFHVSSVASRAPEVLSS